MDEDHELAKNQTTHQPVGDKTNGLRKGVTEIIKDDLIGVSDWKASKLGTLTGFSPAMRAFKGLGSNLSNSTQHLNGLLESISSREQLPSLPDDVIDSDDGIRFEAARRQHGLTEAKIDIGIRNTFWATYLFGGSSLVYLTAVIYWNVVDPPNDAVIFLIRLGFLPFLMALCFKHSYTNWMFRNRALPKFPLKFIRSRDYLPQK
jgi:hypothetical protein